MFSFREGFMAVSERFRRVFEALEPSVHQFAPLSLTFSDGERPSGNFYVLICRRVLDGSVVANPEKLWRRQLVGRLDEFGSGDMKYNHIKTELTDPIETNSWQFDVHSGVGTWNIDLDTDVIGESHMWRERRMFTSLFISDAMYEAWVAAGFDRFLRFDHI